MVPSANPSSPPRLAGNIPGSLSAINEIVECFFTEDELTTRPVRWLYRVTSRWKPTLTDHTLPGCVAYAAIHVPGHAHDGNVPLADELHHYRPGPPLTVSPGLGSIPNLSENARRGFRHGGIAGGLRNVRVPVVGAQSVFEILVGVSG